MKSNSLRVATELAERGISVFPCNSDKSPATNNGFKDASNDKAKIDNWFGDTDHLVGVPTGPVNNLFVIDIDPDGQEWLVDHFLKLPQIRVHSTRRGQHILYKYPENGERGRSTAGKIAKGVDTRGAGGYVIWWPAEGFDESGSLDEIDYPPEWILNKLEYNPTLGNGVQAQASQDTFLEGSRNDSLFRLGGSLRRQGLNEEQLITQLVLTNSNQCSPPLPAKEVAAIARSLTRYEPDSLESNITPRPNSSMSWLQDFELTPEEVAEINDPKWAIDNLVPEGHVVAIAAPPNAGKTTILFHLCKELTADYEVIYVHADTNPSDAKDYYYQAQESGVRYLTPDMKVGKSMNDVVVNLENLANSEIDLKGVIWVFDTLKKMTDVIQKKSLKQLLQTVRKISSRGGTVVLLAHTNKHKDTDGNHIFEGTGDLKADVDELIYFEPLHIKDAPLIVSTRPDKVRADIQPRTFEIDSDRQVKSADDYVDVAKKVVEDFKLDEDLEVIDLITAAIKKSISKQTEIADYCKEHGGFGIRRVKTVLKRYDKKRWNVERMPEFNALHYVLIEELEALPIKQ